MGKLEVADGDSDESRRECKKQLLALVFVETCGKELMVEGSGAEWCVTERKTKEQIYREIIVVNSP